MDKCLIVRNRLGAKTWFLVEQAGKTLSTPLETYLDAEVWVRSITGRNIFAWRVISDDATELTLEAVSIRGLAKQYADAIKGDKVLLLKDQDGHFSMLYRDDENQGRIAFQFQKGFNPIVNPPMKYEVQGLFSASTAYRKMGEVRK